jgi:hypothetical protein
MQQSHAPSVTRAVDEEQESRDAERQHVKCDEQQQAGRPITFVMFLRDGAPVTAAQLLVSAAYVWARFL